MSPVSRVPDASRLPRAVEKGRFSGPAQLHGGASPAAVRSRSCAGSLFLLLLAAVPVLAETPAGAGRSKDADPTRFTRVELTLDECRQGAGRVEVSPDTADVYLDREPRRVAWVVVNRQADYRWILKKKGPMGKNVLPGKKEILRPEHDAFFSAEPTNDPRPGDRWRYNVRVERLEGDKWKLCARIDPEIFIHGNP